MKSNINDNAIYEHFSAYGLAESGKAARRLQQLSESELAQFFTIYIAQARRRSPVFRADAGNMDIYPDSWDPAVSLDTVKQLAIYAHRVYLHDALLELAHGWQDLEYDLGALLQYPTEEERRGHHLAEVAQAIEDMLALRPLVEAGIVHFAPTFFIQDHRNPRNIYLDNFYSSKGLADEIRGPGQPFTLPPAFDQYIRDHFHVVPARYSNDRLTLYPTETLTPRSSIALYFDGDPFPHFQMLGDVSPSKTEEMIVDIHYALDEHLPDEIMFWDWVEGTKREVLRERTGRLQLDLIIAGEARAKFLTSLPTSKDLLQLSTTVEKSTSTDVMTALLKMKLPYFDQASFGSIALARHNETAFEDFRIALNKAFREINNLQSPQEIQERIDEIRRDLLQIPLEKIDQRMKNFGHTLFPGAALILGSLAATILLQGTPLFAVGTLAGGLAFGGTEIAKVLQSRREQLTQIKELPSFFYWGLTRQTPQHHSRQLLPRMGRKHLSSS
ncbi:MAG: hypothetical protein WCD86_01800 [Ktedonobacteraceae bacterium]